MTDRDSLRVGLVADLLEEGWPSMDLVAEMLHSHLARLHVATILMRPALRPRVGRLVGSNGRPLTTDRIINRFWDYPRWLRGHSSEADVFHILDHSYAHLALELPPGRIVVTCHDTDAFRPLVDGASRESKLPRVLVRRTLEGLRRADVVTCVSETTRQELVDWQLVPRERTEVVPNGVDSCFSSLPDPEADRLAADLAGDGDHLLHVGSTIGRKRVDLLLRVFAAVRAAWPSTRLVRVGGPFTSSQRQLAAVLGVQDAIVHLPFLDRQVLAALYRRAALVLLPSEREGFGLPLIEAMASGTPVVSTSLPVLREVGGNAATYAPLGEVDVWRDAVIRLLGERRDDRQAWEARREACEARAAGFSWARHAACMRDIYERLGGRPSFAPRASAMGSR